MPKLSEWNFISQLNVFNPAVDLIGEYKDFKTDVLVKCRYCNKEYEMPPAKLLSGQVHNSADSKFCTRPKQVRYNYAESLDIKSLLTSIGKHAENKFELLSYYTDLKTPLRVKCRKCNKELEVSPKKLSEKSYRCPNCSEIRRRKKIETEIFNGKDTGIKRRLSRDCEWCIMTRTYDSCPRCYFLESKTYLIDEFYNLIHPDIILKEKFSHRYKPITCKCKKMWKRMEFYSYGVDKWLWLFRM